PAAAALMGLLILGQHLRPADLVAIMLVVIASAGASRRTGQPKGATSQGASTGPAASAVPPQAQPPASLWVGPGVHLCMLGQDWPNPKAGSPLDCDPADRCATILPVSGHPARTTAQRQSQRSEPTAVVMARNTPRPGPSSGMRTSLHGESGVRRGAIAASLQQVA